MADRFVCDCLGTRQRLDNGVDVRYRSYSNQYARLCVGTANDYLGSLNVVSRRVQGADGAQKREN